MEPSAAVPAATTSLATRMVNVFAAPGEVFDEVKSSKPSTANWLVPTLLALVAGVLSVFIIYSQPAILQQIQEQQAKAMDDQVKAGKITQAQAEQYGAMADKYSGLTKYLVSIVLAVVVVARLFWCALVLWLLGKWFLQAGFSYQQALEVVGLTGTIMILGSLVTTLLIVWLGKILTVSLLWFAPNSAPQSLEHMALSQVEFFDLWQTGVMAVGLARLAGVSWGKALPLVGGYWLVMASFLVSIGWLWTHLSTGFK
jgi:hypothetical protein